MGQLVNSTDLSPVFEISDALLLNGVELDGAAVWVAKVLKKKYILQTQLHLLSPEVMTQLLNIIVDLGLSNFMVKRPANKAI